jgi:RNA polymerase sigma factor (sigma-70 family)
MKRSNLQESDVPKKPLFGDWSALNRKPARRDAAHEYECLQRAIDTLPHRLWQVVTLRYYGEEGRGLTLAKIARRLGVCSERIRQLLATAMARLRTEYDSLVIHENTDRNPIQEALDTRS